VASRSKKSSKSQKRQAESAAETLEQIDSLGERIIEWVAKNPLVVLGTALGILIVAAAWGLAGSYVEGRRVEASAALAEVQAEFRLAMGVDPSSFEVIEPANPETGQRIRTEFIDRFRQVAQDHDGTAAGALAQLEAGALQEALGQTDEAIETWRASADELDSDDPIRALLWVRVAMTHEAASHWSEAAEAHEKASTVEGYPLRYAALADAARCFAEAGENERALAAFDRIESEAPEQRVAEHVAAKMRELRARESLE